MTNFPDYHKATNTAYEVLINQDIFELPVNLNKIIFLHRRDIRLLTYSQMAARFSMTASEFREVAPSEFGFTMKQNCKKYILYNEEKGYYTNRFTIAHEIGHAILGHEAEDSVVEREANCFARNLLCPVPAIDALGISNTDGYTGWFHVSDSMAEISIKNILSDRYHIEDCYKSKINDLLYIYMTGESLASAYSYIYQYI